MQGRSRPGSDQRQVFRVSRALWEAEAKKPTRADPQQVPRGVQQSQVLEAWVRTSRLPAGRTAPVVSLGKLHSAWREQAGG